MGVGKCAVDNVAASVAEEGDAIEVASRALLPKFESGAARKVEVEFDAEETHAGCAAEQTAQLAELADGGLQF